MLRLAVVQQYQSDNNADKFSHVFAELNVLIMQSASITMTFLVMNT